VSEVALSLVLLIGAGLLIKSFSRLNEVDPGFRTEGVLTFQVTLTEGKSSPQKVNFIEQILERLRALPSVQAAAATDSLPLTDFNRITAVDVEGRPPIDLSRVHKPGEVTPVSRPTVTLDYFKAMDRVEERTGIHFAGCAPLRGVVIVNEAFEKISSRAKARSANESASWVGCPGALADGVGVVSDVRQTGLAKRRDAGGV